MPNGGTMIISKKPHPLPGNDGYGTIEIVYNFNAGIHVSAGTDDQLYVLTMSLSFRMVYLLKLMVFHEIVTYQIHQKETR